MKSRCSGTSPERSASNITSQYTAPSSGSPCSSANRIVARLSLPKEQEAMALSG